MLFTTMTDQTEILPQMPTNGGRVLVVDLDGTVLKTDLLYECLWSGLSESPWSVVKAIAGSYGNRVLLKERLCEVAPLALESLPYRAEVLDHIRRRRAEGDRIILATASAQALADKIADHLGLFDEVYGSAGTLNLKAGRKASFLVDRFGAGGFDYLGDSLADLQVWEAANEAHVAGGSRTVTQALAGRDGPVSQVGGRESRSLAAMKAMRPHQWSKNLLVFLPAFAAHETSLTAWLYALMIFVTFCLVASGLYLVNDLLDLSSDRTHPRKRLRPLAAGTLPLLYGSLLSSALIFAGLLFAALLGMPALVVTLSYIILTTSYSFYFKRKILLDICVLSGLYTMRVLAGAAATDISISVWLLGFTIFFFFGLAAVKRLAEIAFNALGEVGTLSGRAYEARDGDIVAAMAIASYYASVLVFALYLHTQNVAELYMTPAILWLVCPLLLYWSSRTVLLAHRGLVPDDPVVFAFRDKVSRICFVLLVVIFLAATTADFGSLLGNIYMIPLVSG
jgi:4-hydroxybenzoate polyprenyltransferase